MKQKDFFSGTEFGFKKEHGGTMSAGRRRARRPLSTKHPLHLTLRSDFAYGKRSLLRHRPTVLRIMKKAAARFHVSVYNHAVCSNHLHLLVRGKTREGLQNFFRVFAGHLAQEILREFPLSNEERRGTAPSRGQSPVGKRGGAPTQGQAKPKTTVKNRRSPHPKNQRKFWAVLIYSRVMTWGKDFKNVAKYILQNTLEALYIITYKPRKRPSPSELNRTATTKNNFRRTKSLCNKAFCAPVRAKLLKSTNE
jgi:REP element-mobilizing transposase RayT